MVNIIELNALFECFIRICINVGGRMKLLGRACALNVQKVMWLLSELDLKYQHVELGGKFGGLHDIAFSQYTPIKRVPVLCDNERVVWESHAILRYLVACYGGDYWYPQCPYQRSLYERWLDWSQTSFQPVFMEVFWKHYRTPSEKRDMPHIVKYMKKTEACLLILNQQLERSEYLAGNSVSIADIAVGALIYRLVEQGLDIVLPIHVARWYECLQKRAGYQSAIMCDFNELKGRDYF